MAPFAGLAALDIGCGGGLVAEPLARMGATVTAVDADPVAIEAARLHAAEREVTVDYQLGSSDELAAAGRKFDLVLALEIVEHVADRDEFLRTLGALVAPGGLLILSTLNRTLKSLVLGVGMAEHVLRWVEPGTHDWRKFVKPSELARGLRAIGFGVADLTGLVFDPLKGEFRLAVDDVGVNYFMTATRAV
jgi:2-polyprenyl-6-hydroxyphenyl methylase/3-demethylubiquinone-9 3-methyltransferase